GQTPENLKTKYKCIMARRNNRARHRESGYRAMKERARTASILHWGPRAGCAACLVFFVLGVVSAARAQDTGIPRKLTLKEAVRLAVQNSRDLALARLQYGLVQREAGVARSAFRPNFYTGTGAAYTSGFPLMAGGGVPAVFSLSYDQQIFNSPLKGEQRAAEQRAEGQRFSME